MSFRLSHWIAALAAAGMLCAGCGALHSGRVATDHTGAGSAARSSRANDVSAEDLAEAHAHYADAVLHELRDESDLALQEYYAAALKDPADDDLVLEVSRRLLQAKQPEKALEVLKRATQRSNASAAPPSCARDTRTR